MPENNLYKDIFDLSPISLILTNADGLILEANHQALQLLGCSKDELNHLNLSAFLPYKTTGEDPTHKTPFVSFNDILETAVLTQEFLMQKKNGDSFFVELLLSRNNKGSEEIIIWQIRPIQREKKLIYELKERAKEQQALLKVTETLFKYNDVNRALSKCIPFIREAWEFPEYTAVRVKLVDGSGYVTEGFKETAWGLFTTIEGNKQAYGTIEVYYSQEVQSYGGFTFLKEEKKLIDGLAKLFSIFLDNLHTMKKLQENEKMITQITNQIPANTYQFEILPDGNVRVLFASKGLNEFIYDYTADELVNTPTKVIDLIIDEDKKVFYQVMKDGYHHPKTINLQYRTLHNNTIRWRWFRATPVSKENGQIVWYGSSQDVTPFIDYIDILEQILSDISHIIRRPVATMLGLTDLIDHTSLTETTIKEISKKLKIVAKEMDEYTQNLNSAYNEKKLNMSAEKIGFPPFSKRERL